MRWADLLALNGHDVYCTGFSGRDTKKPNLTFLECGLFEAPYGEYDVAMIAGSADDVIADIGRYRVKAKLWVVQTFWYMPKHLERNFARKESSKVFFAHPFMSKSIVYNDIGWHADDNSYKDRCFWLPIPLASEWGKSHCDKKKILFARKAISDIGIGTFNSRFGPIIAGAAQIANELNKELCFVASTDIRNDTGRIKTYSGSCPITVHETVAYDELVNIVDNSCFLVVVDSSAERGASQVTALPMGVLSTVWTSGLAAEAFIGNGYLFDGNNTYDYLSKTLKNPALYEKVLKDAQASLSDHLFSNSITYFNDMIKVAQGKGIL
jgi:hypothetical protein